MNTDTMPQPTADRTEPVTHMVHEAEVQRQHVRLQLPLSIRVNNHSLQVLDWSHSGVAFNSTPLQRDDMMVKCGDVLEAILHFQFGSFSLDVPVSCEVRHVAADGGRTGCRFQEMNERNISIMQYLVSAYINGSMIQVGDILDIAARKNFTTPRNVPSSETLSTSQKAAIRSKKILYTALIGVTSFLLVAYSAMAIYERLYVVESSAAVVIAAKDASGQSRPVVEALIPMDAAVHIARDMPAMIRLPGYDTHIDARVYEVIVDDVSERNVRLYLTPETVIPAQLLRSPAKVTIDIF